MSKRSRQKRAAQAALAKPDPAAQLREQHAVATRRVEEQAAAYQRFWWDSARWGGSYPDFDRGGYGHPMAGGYPYGDRRQDPSHAPLPYLTEPEYFAGIALARDLLAGNHLAIGFLEHLSAFIGPVSVSFVLRGQSPGAAASGPLDADGDGQADVDPLVKLCTEAFEEWAELNDWGQGDEDREEESRRRVIRDGDLTLRHFKGASDQVPKSRFVEPEFIRTPPGDSIRDTTYLGVETAPGDAESVVRIHVCEDPADPTDVVPVEATRFTRMKGNVDRSSKRGLSDFYPTAESLRKTFELLDNMGHVAQLQAKIAWIEKFGPAVSGPQAAGVIAAGETYPIPKYTPYSGVSQATGEQYLPGSKLHVENGREFMPGPTSSPQGFIAIQEAVMRGIAFRFGLPASFAGEGADSYAGALVAGSPFVRIIGARQKRHQGFTRALALAVLALCEESGRLPRGITKRVRPVCTSEPVVIADEEKQARTFLSLYAESLADPVEWLKAHKADPKVTAANIAAWRKKFPPPGSPPPTEPPPGGGGPTPAPPGSAGGDGSSPNDPLAGLFGEGGEPPGGTFLSEAAPGPPPRPGLVWNDGTKRWRHPETGEEYGPQAPHAGRVQKRVAAAHAEQKKAQAEWSTAIRINHENFDRLDAAVAGAKTEHDWNEVIPQYRERCRVSRDAARAASARLDAAKAAVRDALVEGMAARVKNPAKFSRSTVPANGRSTHELDDPTPAQQKVFDDAHEFLAQVCHWPEGAPPPYRAGLAKDGRAFYSDGALLGIVKHDEPVVALDRTYGQLPGAEKGGDAWRINYDRKEATKIHLHELGHFIEFRKKGVQKKAQEFLARRTAGEEPTNLRAKFGGYDADETGRKDSFDRAFGDTPNAYYVGKKYHDGATEVVSMGLQLLYENPGHFAEADPDYFKFMVEVLTR